MNVHAFQHGSSTQRNLNSKCEGVKDLITLNSGLFSAAQQPPTQKPRLDANPAARPHTQVPEAETPAPGQRVLRSEILAQKTAHEAAGVSDNTKGDPEEHQLHLLSQQQPTQS